MSTRSGLVRQSLIDTSPSRVRKGVSPKRSPARARKSSPPARASRKSPSRKSPSRKSATSPKYPARKSPSRTVKESVEVAPSVPKSPGKRPALKTSAVVKLEDVSAKYEIYRSTRSKRTEYSVRDFPSSFTSTEVSVGEKLNGVNLDTDSSTFGDIYGLRSRRLVEDAVPRRPSKLRELIDSVPDIRRSFSKSLSKSLSKSVSESVSKSVDAYSDEENSEEEVRQKEKSRSMTRKLATPLPVEGLTRPKFEFGGRTGSLALIFIIPLTVLATLSSCKKSCTLDLKLDSSYKSYTTWFSTQSLLLIASQYAIQAVFLLLPIFGRTLEKVDATGRRYCFNSLFVTFFTTSLIFALDFFKILHINTILSSYLSLATTSYLFSVFLALILFIKSRRADENDLNSYGNTGYTTYDFFLGREIYPYIKRLNVKLWVSRISNVTALILTVLIFSHGIILPKNSLDNYSLDKLSIENYTKLYEKIQFKPTILLFSMMQMIYVLNFIIKEYQITSTFYWQSEGMGYLQIVSSALYPFYFTTISKFVVDNELVLSTNVLITASVVFILGFIIMVLSNNIKYEFRRNPLQPRLSLLDSMPTFLGKKLLVSNLWGLLRHPNYAGDILIHTSLALPGVLSQQYVAAIPALTTILMLLHRTWRDHARCKQRYGAAWYRYCKRVPSAVIPKIL
ncbi:delta(14)-sterol reductase TM7SF2 [Epargyreus clarus]|uniref:delta(14)-sterol reductase TM7SF2 n=1 Tax=Epargyreus clarus TaxID=520877 RepID=UPI003C2F75CD